jgi:hypothetical protein
MTITAAQATDAPSNWVQHEDGFTIDGGKAFLAWEDNADSPEHGFTIGIRQESATDDYVAQVLAAVESRFPDNSVDDEYADMGVRHFEFSPASAWVSPDEPAWGIPLD